MSSNSMKTGLKRRTVSSRELYEKEPLINNWKEKTRSLVGYSTQNASVHIIKHVPIRLTRNRFSCPIIGDSSKIKDSNIQSTNQRRESYLYKYEVDSSILPERFSSYTSLTSKENNSIGCGEDIIVTPFAQILALLHHIRDNVAEMSNANTNHPTNESNHLENILLIGQEKSNESLEAIRSTETLHMVEWCLKNLESIHTDRSVSSLATDKFKKMLNLDLHQYECDSSSYHQISDFINNTFMDDNFDLEDTLTDKTNSNTHYENIDCGDYCEKDHENVAKEFLPLGISCTQITQINKILDSSVNQWDLNLFRIYDISKNVLSLVTFTIFKNRQIIPLFQIPIDILRHFLNKIESAYRNLPYHNSLHAADVVQTANAMLSLMSLQSVFTDLEIFAVLFACVIHDVDHPGVTNQFLINTSDRLATLYNDQSVLENHHLATSFKILKDEKYDILVNLSRQEKSTFRKLVIDMVLATDMSRHMSLLADLKTMVETKKVSGSGLLSMDKYNDRVTILQNLVHCADLSNPTKSIIIYEEWVERIMKEFFLQGDKEKELGIEVSPMCDRETAAIDKTQVSFIDYIVHPLWESWCELVNPDSKFILDTLDENRQYYFLKTCQSQTITEVDGDENELELNLHEK